MESVDHMEGWRSLLCDFLPVAIPEVRMTPPIDKSAVVAGAAASDFSDELTVIMNTVQLLLAEMPDREELLTIRAAAQRSAFTMTELLNYAALRGARPSWMTTKEAITGKVNRARKE